MALLVQVGNFVVDVCIIGAGIAGCACARFLSAYDLTILVVDAAYDIACGTTRANSGIVHAGFDPIPGTAKARYNVAGSRMFPRLSRELGFDFEQNGTLVVAFDEREQPAIQALLARGEENGVEGLRIMHADELHAREPNLNDVAVCALWAPTGGIVDPYGACLAFAENAADNGVRFQFDTHVDAIKHVGEGWSLMTHHTRGIDTLDRSASTGAHIDARVVINAAGLESGRINDLASSAEHIHITPRAGEYVLLDNVWGEAFHSTVFQVPSEAGKGVLVSPTTEGNILIGPNAVVRDSITDRSTTSAGLAEVLDKATRTWPDIPTRDVITNFAGLRASCVESPDFHLGEPADAPGFFNVAGFDSPGLTAAPAVAAEFAQTIAERLGARPDPSFNPHREAPLRFARLSDEQRAQLIAADPAWGRIVCRCECVSEAEIIAAIHSPVPATTTDAIKWRTRAGMGRCQAGFCLPLTAQIIARELGMDVADVCKSGDGSRLAFGHRGMFDRLPRVSDAEDAAGSTVHSTSTATSVNASVTSGDAR